ncbi:hypothetical protein AgCh_010110 [Apium graveolens]
MDQAYSPPRHDEMKLLGRSIESFKTTKDFILKKRMARIYIYGKSICVMSGHPQFGEVKKEEKPRLKSKTQNQSSSSTIDSPKLIVDDDVTEEPKPEWAKWNRVMAKAKTPSSVTEKETKSSQSATSSQPTMPTLELIEYKVFRYKGGKDITWHLYRILNEGYNVLVKVFSAMKKDLGFTKVLEQACMRTRSQYRKDTLEEVEMEMIIVMGEPAAESKALKDYSQPKINDIQSSIFRATIAANTFEIKPGTIQMGFHRDLRHLQVQRCFERCRETETFPFSLRDKDKSWLHSIPPGSIATWEDLAQKFLTKFFPMEKIAAIRNALTQFAQHSGESLCEAWERYKEILRKCHHHGMPDWIVINCF